MSAKAIPKDRTHMSPCSVSWRRWYSGFAACDGLAPHRVRVRASGGMPHLLELTTGPPGAGGLLNCRPYFPPCIPAIRAMEGDHFRVVPHLCLVVSGRFLAGSPGKGGWATAKQVSCPWFRRVSPKSEADAAANSGNGAGRWGGEAPCPPHRGQGQTCRSLRGPLPVDRLRPVEPRERRGNAQPGPPPRQQPPPCTAHPP